MSCLVSRIGVLTTNMPPEVSIAAFALHRFARLPLLSADLFEVTIAVLIQAVIADKSGFHNSASPAHRNDC